MAIRNFKTSSIKTGVQRTTIWDQSAIRITNFSILMVGGGGSAGDANSGGGGGAGGLLYTSSVNIVLGTTCTATVGAGGVYPTSRPGVDSVFSGSGITTLTALGGGNGAGESSTAGTLDGGSGGGASFNRTGGTALLSGAQGFNGGTANSGSYLNGGAGGGGAGATGGSPGAAGGAGGVGSSTYSSWGSATSSGENVSGTYYYAGGGGGVKYHSTPGTGGSGGGGAGTQTPVSSGNAGTANTGGGGGAGDGGGGGNGGSGIIILRTSGSYTASATTGSPTRYETGGYTYYKFTGTGSITI